MGLFASYSDVQFRAPVLAGDVLEATCEVTADPSRGPSAAAVLDDPIVVHRPGTVVVPPPAPYEPARQVIPSDHEARP